MLTPAENHVALINKARETAPTFGNLSQDLTAMRHVFTSLSISTSNEITDLAHK